MRLRQRVPPALVYGITSLALWTWFDTLEGMEPGDGSWLLKHHSLPRLAIYGTILFAIATVISFVAPRVAAWTALSACILSWPYWIVEVAHIGGNWAWRS